MGDLRVFDLKFCPYCAAGYEWQEGWPSEGPCPGCRRAEKAEAENEQMKKLLYEDEWPNGVVPQLHRAEDKSEAAEAALSRYRDENLELENRIEAVEVELAAWKDTNRVISGERDAAEAENERLQEALVEIGYHVQMRRTSIHADGTEMFAQPILGRINSIVRAALARERQPTNE